MREASRRSARRSSGLTHLSAWPTAARPARRPRPSSSELGRAARSSSIARASRSAARGRSASAEVPQARVARRRRRGSIRSAYHWAQRWPWPTADAAFFDLDKTLIEGSSAIHFGRAAYRAGDVSRRQIASDAWANIRFRLNGSTDEGTEELKQRILDAIAGWRVVDLARLGPDVLAGMLPLLYREMLDEAYAHQDAAGPCSSSPPPRRSWPSMLAARARARRRRSGMRSEVRDGVYTGRPAGPFTYREGKAEAIRELAAERGHRPGRVVRLLGLGVRPADAARRRPPGGGATRTPSSERGARGGLADHALRQARAPAEARRGASGRSRSWAAVGATWRRGLAAAAATLRLR